MHTWNAFLSIVELKISNQNWAVADISFLQFGDRKFRKKSGSRKYFLYHRAVINRLALTIVHFPSPGSGTISIEGRTAHSQVGQRTSRSRRPGKGQPSSARRALQGCPLCEIRTLSELGSGKPWGEGRERVGGAGKSLVCRWWTNAMCVYLILEHIFNTLSWVIIFHSKDIWTFRNTVKPL